MTNNIPASFKLRALAYLVEHSYNLLLTMIFVLLILSQPTLVAAGYVLFLFLMLYFLNPLILYQSIILTHYFGGSFGKLLTGLEVVNEQGARLSLKRIVFRHTIGYSFSWLALGLGFAAIIKDPKKQGWHDKTVGSQVVVKNKLWPVAVLLCMVSLAGVVYVSILSWQRATTGPLKTEVQSMIQQMQIEAEAEKEKQTQQTQMKVLPLPSETP